MHNLDINNQDSLEELAWAISMSRGEFSLILARCNAVSLRRQLAQELKESHSVEFYEVVLEPSTRKLYQSISNLLCTKQNINNCPTVFVYGLESVTAIKQMLYAANQVREEFRKNFHFPVVFWVTDKVLQKFMREAPDLYSWSITVEFTLSTSSLIELIQTTAGEVFAKVLAAGSGRFIDNTTFNLQVGSSRRHELEFAWQELKKRCVNLDPEIEASLQFVLGLDVHASMEQSRQYYERSLILLQKQAQHHHEVEDSKLLIRQGCLLYCLGLWWRTYAMLHRSEYKQACEKAKSYFLQCIQSFEQAKRLDLVANFINALGGVLQRLEYWNELETLAQRALNLHLQYADEFKLARVYGFFAEVNLAKYQFIPAQQAAKTALEILNRAKQAISNASSTSAELKADLEWEMSYHQGWYLYALGRSLLALGEVEDAITIFETARVDTKPQYDPQLYISILGKLHDSYFQLGEYLTAFSIKQLQRSIQQQYAFRAFIGAGRLQPKQQIANPGLVKVEHKGSIAPEITESGRQQDIENLRKRMGRHDYKLTVIHGQSGVGKSSILQAGLIPALKQKPIGTRDVVPVLLQVYTDWMGEFSKRLYTALNDTGNWACELSPSQPHIEQAGISFIAGEIHIERPSQIKLKEANHYFLVGENHGMKSILDHLKICVENNLLIVLIFDQLEEFFVVNQDSRTRYIFYKFLRDCLHIPYIKVILSLREDYLHYLLECNNRLINFDVISNNILDNKILYYLGNFTKIHAKFFLQSLNNKTHLSLEEPLIDELLKDLSREHNEIRPIELQIVGTQLETEEITTLEQYHLRGPKEKLVERFLEEVIQDCGLENERAARIILYLLTDENGLRPLKTKTELAKDLENTDNGIIVKLDIILEILVRSNLVLKIPQDPTDAYQLVHDYLVTFIRQSQQATEIEESKLVKEQRKYAEAQIRRTKDKLNRSLKRQRNLAIATSIIISVLTVGTLYFGLQTASQKKQAEIANIQALNSASEALFLLDNRFDSLISSLKATYQLRWTKVPSILEKQIEDLLRQAVYGIEEKNRLHGHKNEVLAVSFSPDTNIDNQIIATASADHTVILWNTKGKLLHTLQGHTSLVTDVAFSPDGQIIASSGADGTIRLWNRKGNEILVFKENKSQLPAILSLSFSPNGTIASANEDGTIKLWSIDGQLLQSWKAHEDKVLDVNFSPNGKMIASSGTDKIVKIWDSRGKLLRTLTGHKDWIYSITFSPNNEILASVGGGSDRTMKIWQTQDGNLMHSIEAHTNTIKSVAFSPNNLMIATASDDKKLKLWSRDGNLINSFKGHKSDLNDISFSPDSRIMATAGGDKITKLWKYEPILQKTIPAHQKELVWSVAWAPDSQVLASASADKTIKLWSRNGKLLKTLTGHNDWILDVAFSPDGEVIASASEDKTVRLWTRDGKLLKTLMHGNWVYGVSFSRDSSLLASASMDGTVKIWNREGILAQVLKADNSETFSDVSFSPDNQLIAASTNANEIVFWNRSGKLVSKLLGNDDRFTSLSFSPDGQLLVAGSYSNRSVLWNLNQNKTENRPIFIEGHHNKVRSVAFSPDSKIIASASDDYTVRLWSRDGVLLKTLEGDLGANYSVSFSPDGKILASTGDNGTIKLWNIENIERKAPSRKELFQRGCDWVRDYLQNNQEGNNENKNLCG